MGSTYDEALRDAITAVVREHLPQATEAGRVSGFLLSFNWVDSGDAGGEHTVVVDRDPVTAVRNLSRSVASLVRPPASLPGQQRNSPPRHRRRTDPPAPVEPD